MPIRKQLKKTWFNRLVVAPLILISWVICYPIIIPFAIVFVFITEMLPEMFGMLKNDWNDYISLIKQAVKFIFGRTNNK